MPEFYSGATNRIGRFIEGLLLRRSQVLLKALNWGGAALLLWLAWKIANAGRVSEMTDAKPVGFLTAATFQWINPKGWLVAVSAAGTYLQPVTDNALAQSLAFGALFFAAALPAGLVWLALGAWVHRLLRNERQAQIFNVVMAATLALSVVTMFR